MQLKKQQTTSTRATTPLLLKKHTAPLRFVHPREGLVTIPLPPKVRDFPELRYMGSKHRLLPWIHSVLDTFDFETAADPFVGSGSVSYLLKAMGKRVIASDFLNFPTTLAIATIENSHLYLDGPALKRILNPVKNAPDFIERMFSGVFYTRPDLRFLDRISHTIEKLNHPHQQALARAALFRSCLKKQPRGVDLVYLDPPYVPRSDDNCYVKRYHFLEGLSWIDKRGRESFLDKIAMVPLELRHASPPSPRCWRSRLPCFEPPCRATALV